MFVKICGITTREALEAARSAGADAVGFVFAPSVRKIEAGVAAALTSSVHGRVLRVAVMRHPSQGEVDAVLADFEPDVLQTDLEDLAGLRLPELLEVWPVVRPATPIPAGLAGRVLCEGPQSGSGVVSDWSLAASLRERELEVILAGGLTPDNVGAAIAAAQPYGVDVSSGVESEPGVKDLEKIEAFIEAARVAFDDSTRGGR